MSTFSITVAITGCVYIIAVTYAYVYIFREALHHKRRFQTEQLSQEEAERVNVRDNKAANTLASILGAWATIILFAFFNISFTDNFSQTGRCAFFGAGQQL
jgi:hypothetical protein